MLRLIKDALEAAEAGKSDSDNVSPCDAPENQDNAQPKESACPTTLGTVWPV